MKDVKQVIATLKAESENEVFDNIVVKNINITDKGNWDMVSLTLNNPVTAMVRKDETSDDFIKSTSRVVFVSRYSIAAMFSDNEDTAFARSYILESDKLLKLLLSYCTVNVIAEHIAKDTEYSNPFSDNEDTSTIDHETYFHHLYNLKLGKKGLKALDKLEDKIIEGAVEELDD